ncbi:MAG: hypothetical protein ACO1OB_24190 [Archangium sp.]
MKKPKKTLLHTRVILDVDNGEAAQVAPWRKQWKRDIKHLDDSGCGCCVVILGFDATEEAIADLEARTNQRMPREPLPS